MGDWDSVLQTLNPAKYDFSMSLIKLQGQIIYHILHEKIMMSCTYCIIHLIICLRDVYYFQYGLNQLSISLQRVQTKIHIYHLIIEE